MSVATLPSRPVRRCHSGPRSDDSSAAAAPLASLRSSPSCRSCCFWPSGLAMAAATPGSAGSSTSLRRAERTS